MSDRYQGKYRIQSARHPHWNYAWEGAYFLTVCTQHREPWFGAIKDGNMKHSTIGEIVEKEWLNSISLRSDMNVSLGAHIVMPNHFHGILIIGANQYNRQDDKNASIGQISGDVGWYR